MFKSASRSILRVTSSTTASYPSASTATSAAAAAHRQLALQRGFAPARRFLSTGTKAKGADKPSTWKGTIAKWTAAGALVWWYNTSDVFAEEPSCMFNIP